MSDTSSLLPVNAILKNIAEVNGPVLPSVPFQPPVITKPPITDPKKPNQWGQRVINELKKFESTDLNKGEDLKAILKSEILAGKLPSTSQYHLFNSGRINVADGSKIMISTNTAAYNNILVILIENSSLDIYTITGSTLYVLMFAYTDTNIVILDPSNYQSK